MELYVFDQSYVDRLRDGDEATEAHFVSYFGQILGIMLRARMLPPERVDDVRQETFARVVATLRREGGVRQPDRFGAFVNSICKNVLRESNRERSKSQPLELGHLEPPDKIIDLESSLISDESTMHVRAILAEMGKKDRDLMKAVFLEEGDKDDICRRFGVDRDYLRVQLHRAKLRFRSLYQKGTLEGRAAGGSR